jgi:eukaryotic-like serine/threonine-protein kinase
MRTVANIAYDQGRLIGQGQNSLGVFLCKDEQLGGDFAVKIIEKAKVQDPANIWAEAQAMHDARHENVVHVQYACDKDYKLMLAMPYYARGSLAERIVTSPLRLLEVVRVGQGILSGLHHIHVAGYTHNDLKPSNVLFSDSDTPMISDLGQSQKIGPAGVAPAPAVIYAGAIPPELLLTRNGTIQSDVYQAGLALYRAVNGNPSFDFQYNAAGADLQRMTLDGDFPNRESYLPHVPRSLRSIINKALQTDLGRRYATALEFATALGRVHVKHDWHTVCHPGGEIEWRSAGSPDLVVRQVARGPKWDVTIHNERPGRARRIKRILWGMGLTTSQSVSHLKQVFVALE